MFTPFEWITGFRDCRDLPTKHLFLSGSEFARSSQRSLLLLSVLFTASCVLNHGERAVSPEEQARAICSDDPNLLVRQINNIKSVRSVFFRAKTKKSIEYQALSSDTISVIEEMQQLCVSNALHTISSDQYLEALRSLHGVVEHYELLISRAPNDETRPGDSDSATLFAELAHSTRSLLDVVQSEIGRVSKLPPSALSAEELAEETRVNAMLVSSKLTLALMKDVTDSPPKITDEQLALRGQVDDLDRKVGELANLLKDAQEALAESKRRIFDEDKKTEALLDREHALAQGLHAERERVGQFIDADKKEKRHLEQAVQDTSEALTGMKSGVTTVATNVNQVVNDVCMVKDSYRPLWLRTAVLFHLAQDKRCPPHAAALGEPTTVASSQHP